MKFKFRDKFSSGREILSQCEYSMLGGHADDYAEYSEEVARS
jgi:hypothetical protein